MGDAILQQQQKRYLKTFAVVFFAMAALMAGTNFLVDPAGIYDVVLINGVNRIKTKAGEYRMYWKIGHLESYKPPVVFLGNSRTEVGINPVSATAQSVISPSLQRFNAAIPASTIYGVKRYMQHVAEVGAASDTVVIGIDYVLFRKSNQLASRAGYSQYESLFATGDDGEPQPFHRLELFSRTLFSLDVFGSSLHTVLHQTDEYDDLGPDGHSLNRQMEKRIMKRKSPRACFLREEQVWITANAKENIAPGSYAFDDGMHDFQAIIDTARAHKIRLLLYITPTHVDLQYLEGSTGAPQKNLAAWKKAVTDAVATSNARYPQQPAIQLWDFSIVNDVIAEPVPDEKNDHLMKWYLDPSHYRDALGDLVLETLFTGKPSVTPAGAPFGYLLTPDTVAQVNELHHESLLRWQAQQPEQYQELKARIASISH
jgi:hypothetical protein